jgi:hypothetical protein
MSARRKALAIVRPTAPAIVKNEKDDVLAARIATERAIEQLDAAAAVLRRGDESCHYAAWLLVNRGIERLREAYELEAVPDTEVSDGSKLSAVQFHRVLQTVLVARHVYQGALSRDREDLGSESIENEPETAACMLELAVQALARMIT